MQVLRQATASAGNDEEKVQAATTGPSSTVGSENSNEKNKAMDEQPKTFPWRHLNYAVPVPGEHQLLLDDVSRFVAPGKLTAFVLAILIFVSRPL